MYNTVIYIKNHSQDADLSAFFDNKKPLFGWTQIEAVFTKKIITEL